MFESKETFANDAIAHAFAAAGASSAHSANLHLLEECWRTHGPDVTAARRAFSEALTQLPGGAQIRAVVGDERWNEGVSRYTFRNCAGLAREVRRANAQLAAKAKLALYGYSQTPEAVRSRESKWKNGRHSPAANLAPQRLQQTKKGEWSAKSVREANGRKRRGVVLVKAEFDPKTLAVILISGLPESLRAFASWTKPQALDWCEKQERAASDKLAQIAKVRAWCSAANDSGTLGDHLTADIVARLADA